MSDQNRPTDSSKDSSDDVTGYGLNVPTPVPPPRIATDDQVYTTNDVTGSTVQPPETEYKGEPMPLPAPEGNKPERLGGPTF